MQYRSRLYTLYLFAFSCVLFQCCEEHHCLAWGQILKPATYIEPSPGLLGNVMQMVSLASKNSVTSLRSKRFLLYVLHFRHFQDAICRPHVRSVRTCQNLSQPFLNLTEPATSCSNLSQFVQSCLNMSKLVQPYLN